MTYEDLKQDLSAAVDYAMETLPSDYLIVFKIEQGGFGVFIQPPTEPETQSPFSEEPLPDELRILADYAVALDRGEGEQFLLED